MNRVSTPVLGRVSCLLLIPILLGCDAPPDDPTWQGSAGLVYAPTLEPVLCPPWGCLPAPTVIATNVRPTSIVSNGTTVWFTSTFDLLGPKVVKVPAGGGATTTIVSGNVHSVSIGLNGSRVYWSNWGGAASSQGVWSVSTGGAVPSQVYAQTNDTEQVQGLAVAPTLGGLPGDVHVYWANAYKARLYDVHQYPHPWFPWLLFTSTTSVLPDTDPADGTNYYPFSVTVDLLNLYFIEDNGVVKQVPRSGGPDTQLDTGAETKPIATDGASVFYVKGGQIKEVPVGGGAVTDFANALGTISAMTVRDGNLYWACSTCGTVVKKPIAGGGAVTLAAGQTSPGAIAVDDTHVYWGTTTALKRVAK